MPSIGLGKSFEREFSVDDAQADLGRKILRIEKLAVADSAEAAKGERHRLPWPCVRAERQESHRSLCPCRTFFGELLVSSLEHLRQEHGRSLIEILVRTQVQLDGLRS